jgi:hypothetical protein
LLVKKAPQQSSVVTTRAVVAGGDAHDEGLLAAGSIAPNHLYVLATPNVRLDAGSAKGG